MSKREPWNPQPPIFSSLLQLPLETRWGPKPHIVWRLLTFRSFCVPRSPPIARLIPEAVHRALLVFEKAHVFERKQDNWAWVLWAFVFFFSLKHLVSLWCMFICLFFSVLSYILNRVSCSNILSFNNSDRSPCYTRRHASTQTLRQPTPPHHCPHSVPVQPTLRGLPAGPETMSASRTPTLTQ